MSMFVITSIYMTFCLGYSFPYLNCDFVLYLEGRELLIPHEKTICKKMAEWRAQQPPTGKAWESANQLIFL